METLKLLKHVEVIYLQPFWSSCRLPAYYTTIFTLQWFRKEGLLLLRSYDLFCDGGNHANGPRKMVLTCRESRMLTESNSRPGSIFIPTISGAIIEKRRQHCNREGTLVRNQVTLVNLQALTQLKCLSRKSYLQTFCSAIRNLPTMILIWECPRSFGNVAVHAFKVTRRIVLDLQDFKQYEVNGPWETKVDSG